MHGRTRQPRDVTGPDSSRRPWTILALLAVAQFMVILDITVVNVALPSIGQALNFAPADLQWVVTAYVLFTGGLLLLGGRAADLFGRRRIFIAGLLTFTSASLVSGLASSPDMLIFACAVQGLGAALLSPAALSIITTTYSGAQRTAALSVWGAIGGAGAAAGVLFGGMLTAWLSWEWVFFINVPVGLVALPLALRLLPTPGPRVGRHSELDLAGALTVTGGLVTLVYAIDGAATYGWGSTRTLGLLALGVGLLAAFAQIERTVKRPLVPPATWRLRSLVSSATMMLGATAILIGAFFLNSLYLQDALGASALETGLAFLPFALIIGLTAHLGTHALQRTGARAVVVGGLVVAAAGALLLSVAPDQASYAADLLPGLLMMGAGIGLVFVTVSITAMADVTDHDAGVASGLMQTSHEIGAALGVAVMSTVATTASAGTTVAAGYGDGFIATALVAGILALLALLSVPTVRPATTARVAAH
ncbi:MAG: MFS transporter [Actinobacteria bacterium]|nr:MFS transporter [Actinomycetota bacterium]